MLLDSNIIIYLSNDPSLESFFRGKELYTSIISKIEVLGFHKISELQKKELEDFFDSIIVLELSSSIADKSIALRQQRNISLRRTH
jgi:predicted nucleic acid-binding protein